MTAQFLCYVTHVQIYVANILLEFKWNQNKVSMDSNQGQKLLCVCSGTLGLSIP